jgi:hypothetical protein
MAKAPIHSGGGQRRELAVTILFLPISLSLHLLLFGETNLGTRARYSPVWTKRID